MRDFGKDLKIGFRSIRRQWRVSSVVIVTLALGIGVNAVIFSFVNAVLLNPLPFPEADRLLRLTSMRGGEQGEISLRDIEDLKQRSGIFVDIAVHGQGNGGYNLSGQGRPEEIPALLCSRNLFAVLGVEPALGGVWPEEGDRLRNHSVVLSYDLWKRTWGGDPAVLERVLTLDGADLYRVYGVAPPGLDYPMGMRLYRSIAFRDLDWEDRSQRIYTGLARIRPGVTVEQVRSELSRVSNDLAGEHPDSNAGLRFAATPLREVYVGEARPFLLLLTGASAFVLAIACANVAAVILARSLGEGRKTAIRSALGASRWRIVRMWLAEGILLGTGGGLLAVLLATGGVGLLRALLVDLPHWMVIRVDLNVLAATAAVSIVCGLLTTLTPALQASRVALVASLGGGSRGSSERRWASRSTLVVAQVAVTMVLLVGAGLMVRSFQALQNEDLGFRQESTLTFRVNLGWRSYPPGDQRVNYFKTLLERLQALPAVEEVASNSNPPMGGITDRPGVTLEGQSRMQQQTNPYVNRKYVSPSYFRLAQVGLVRGRTFEPSDALDTQPVTVVSHSAAEALWPDGDVLGKRLKLEVPGLNVIWLEVIGIVEDVQQDRVGGEPGLDVYVSVYQLPNLNAFVMMRTHIDPELLVAQADEVALGIDPDQSTWQYRSMQGRVDDSLWQQRLAGALVSSFAVLAALLAAVGIYGVLAYEVRKRSREIGIRLALGAERSSISAHVMRDASLLVALGLAVGLPLALALSQSIRSLLFEISSIDAASYLAALILIALAALAATCGPAWRASRIDPAVVLKDG